MDENTWKKRWSNDQIRSMLVEQYNAFIKQDTGIKRTLLKDVRKAAATPYAVIISGLRRVGKSTLLAQLAKSFAQDSYYYVNFEDDRFLNFQAEDATDLYNALVELFGEREIMIIDEIQNVPKWEHFVRRYMDLGLKFYITGSNASLLSQDLGTRLTGRYSPFELSPFSFTEYLLFNEEQIPDLNRMTNLERSKLIRRLNSYINDGGIPDALKYPEVNFLRTLYNDVIYRDIAARYKLEGITALKELAYFLISNPASLVSYNKLKERLKLGSVNTVIKYIDFLESSWLFFTVNQYAFSVKRQQVAPKKIYSIDTGMVESVGFSFSPNSGKLLENLVYLQLRRESKNIYYYKTEKGFEVDFYLPEEHHLVQVAENMAEEATRNREIRALEEAVQEIAVKKITLLTDNNDDDLSIGGINTKVQSVTEWLLK
jgi:uncharacterized protein